MRLHPGGSYIHSVGDAYLYLCESDSQAVEAETENDRVS